MTNMNDSRLPGMQGNTQLHQYPLRRCQRRLRFPATLAGHQPIVCVSRQSIPLTAHLSIKWRQQDITEQW